MANFPRAPTGQIPAFSARGFTLLELLLVLGLLALLSTVLVTGANVLFRMQDEQGLEEVFWEAMREGRLQALYDREPVRLTYDRETLTFHLSSRDGEKEFTVRNENLSADTSEVRFLQERSLGSYVLIGGELVDTRPVERVVFHPDGSMTPILVEFHHEGSSRKIRIDPWTGAPFLGDER